MTTKREQNTIILSGRWDHRLRNIGTLMWGGLYVALVQRIRGPLRPGWDWTFESGTYFAKTQSRISLYMADINEGRAYEDALVITSPALSHVKIERVNSPVKGDWYMPEGAGLNRTVLYLHGGGYAYYARAHHNLIALVAQAACARIFALDYRLIPEHPFPAQLEDAQQAYHWLVQSGIDPKRLVVMGDSAGGNLALALLLALRDANEIRPALGVCLCPWTDASNSGESMTRNEKYDWVDKRMADKWAQWFLNGADPRSPLISPLYANLQGLPPLYIQAGGSEILYDMIRAFVEKARAQQAHVKLDVWENMNHDFQAFGDAVPESREALRRIGEWVDRYVP